MSVVIFQKEKDNSIRMFRHYINCLNSTKVTYNLKELSYFKSPKKRKMLKRKEALKKVKINLRKKKKLNSTYK